LVLEFWACFALVLHVENRHLLNVFMSGIQGFRTVAHISIVPAGAEQTEQEMCTDVLSPKMKIKTYFYLPTVEDIWVLPPKAGMIYIIS
jgi:hypothetical protein